MILEHSSNPSISPANTGQCSEDDEEVSDDYDDDDDDASTSSYSSPSASTAANASCSSLRTAAQTSSEQPLGLDSGAVHQIPGGPKTGPGAGGQAGVRDPRAGTGGLNKSRFRGVSYDKKKRKWRVQIKVRHSLGMSCRHAFDNAYHVQSRATCWPRMLATDCCTCPATAYSLRSLVIGLGAGIYRPEGHGAFSASLQMCVVEDTQC